MKIIKRKKITDESVKIGFFTELFSSFFYTGHFPVASGTIASFAAALIFFVKDFSNPIILSVLIVIAFIVGVFTSEKMMKRYGPDPSVVVLDEAVGVWLTALVFIVFSGMQLSLFYMLLCFLFFRFFDIAKFQPARYFDKLHTGLGIMLDDVAAGIYAGLAAYFLSLTNFNPF